MLVELEVRGGVAGVEGGDPAGVRVGAHRHVRGPVVRQAAADPLADHGVADGRGTGGVVRELHARAEVAVVQVVAVEGGGDVLPLHRPALGEGGSRPGEHEGGQHEQQGEQLREPALDGRTESGEMPHDTTPVGWRRQSQKVTA